MYHQFSSPSLPFTPHIHSIVAITILLHLVNLWALFDHFIVLTSCTFYSLAAWLLLPSYYTIFSLSDHFHVMYYVLAVNSKFHDCLLGRVLRLCEFYFWTDSVLHEKSLALLLKLSKAPFLCTKDRIFTILRDNSSSMYDWLRLTQSKIMFCYWHEGYSP